MKAIAIMVMSLLLLPAPAVARLDESGPTPPGLNEDDSAREELQETIEIYMMARMKRVLNLSDDQERKVVPLVSEMNAARREANRDRRLTMMKLRPMVEDETTKDAEILALVDHLEEIETHLRQKELSTRAELRGTLTPRQQVLFIGFMDRFRREMEERVRRLQRGESGPGPGGGPMRPPQQQVRPRPRR